MNRRAAIAGMLGLSSLAAAEEEWDDRYHKEMVRALFDGPKLNERCVVGGLSPGMRFHPVNDLADEWLVTEHFGWKGMEESPTSWEAPVWRICVDLSDGSLKRWLYQEEVIRTH